MQLRYLECSSRRIGFLKTGMDISSRQRGFREWTSETLIYAVVMGFFNDYTRLSRRGIILDGVSRRSGDAGVDFCHVWCQEKSQQVVSGAARDRHQDRPRILDLGDHFFSKFVFLWVIDIVFGGAVEINSFVGLVLIIAVMVIVSREIDAVDQRLGAADQDQTPLGV